MAERSFGLSIDGDRVTVVETLGDIAVSSTSVAAGSLEDSLLVALEGIKQKRNDPAIRVALLAPSVSMRRMDVTGALANSRADFEDAVFAALPVNREVTAVAGAFFDVDGMVGDAVTAGVAVVGPADRVEEIYRLAGKRRIELVASPLTLAGFDGVWLGLHHGLADVTLLSGGRPLAYRQLRAGGLNALLSVLGDPLDPALGPSRLLGALTGTRPDPIADVEVGRYMRMVATELSQTVDYWRKTGEPVPGNSEVLVYGVGGVSIAENALREAGFSVLMPELLLQALSYVPQASRSESLLALCASATTGRHMPQASFTNPLFAALLEARKKVRKRVLVAAASVAVAGFLGLTLVRPFVDGWLSSRRAETNLAAAEAAFAEKSLWYYQKVDRDSRQAIVDQYRGENGTEPYWAQVYRVLFASVPRGSKLSQISSTISGDSVLATVSLTLTTDTYDDLVLWMDRLEDVDGVDRVWSSGFSVSEEGVASFDISLQLKVTPLTMLVSDASGGLLVSPETSVVPLPPDQPAADAPSPVPAPDTTVTTVPVVEGGDR
jgi:hypothetical protein